MIFKRQKHPLPRFPNTVVPMFKRLATPIPADQAKALIPEIDICMQKLQESAAVRGGIDIGLAFEIADACKFLLEVYEERSEKERAKIIGAVRYFAFAEDPFSERSFATGFDDDARVVNHVLELLGIHDRYLSI